MYNWMIIGVTVCTTPCLSDEAGKAWLMSGSLRQVTICVGNATWSQCSSDWEISVIDLLVDSLEKSRVKKNGQMKENLHCNNINQHFL